VLANIKFECLTIAVYDSFNVK